MKLISWNIQWARGIDGRVDPARIVRDARAMGDFDVLCLQEVGANFPAPGLAGSAGENQFEQFAQLLPGFTPVPVAGVDVIAPDGGRRCFGNMILSRYPVLRVLRHQLPWPVDAGAISMPRTLLEVTLESPLGPLRVMNTHLEYYSALQRRAQVEAIRRCHEEACGRAASEMAADRGASPFAAFPHASKAILTGDFNFRPEDPLHARLQEPFTVLGGLNGRASPHVPRLVDAWHHLHGDRAHPVTVGQHDREQWPEAFTCDFIFASEDLLPNVRDFQVDGHTQSSDHQPLLLELR
jgi:endonuclease/exonuclease/phosphatase family metal-dependent hydrolase